MKKYSVGVDLGGTKILAGVVNTETGEVINSTKKKSRNVEGESVIQKIIDSIEKTVAESDIAISEISSIGIGAAGQVDREKGILVSAPNLDCFDLELKKIIENHFKIPVFVGNDVEVATIGEIKFGNGIGYKNLVCIFVGTGVGSAIVCDGKLYSGATGTAGEVGHIIVSTGGRLCGCGENGCLEAYASRTAIEKKIVGVIKKGHNSIIQSLLQENGSIKSKHIKRALELNDEVVFNAITEAAEYLSSGIASVINFFNPEIIILGGGLIEAVDFFFDITVKKAHAKALAIPSAQTKIIRTGLKDFAGMTGAALLEKYYEKGAI
ncbi:MAG TPA: ROK family protein [Candidatus Gastranaerophilales bacterium]|nr:ROK family protein [Candidatus Gastranaerophilales bacterium]